MNKLHANLSPSSPQQLVYLKCKKYVYYDTGWSSKSFKIGMNKKNVSLNSGVKDQLGRLVTIIEALVGFSESYIRNDRETWRKSSGEIRLMNEQF